MTLASLINNFPLGSAASLLLFMALSVAFMITGALLFEAKRYYLTGFTALLGIFCAVFVIVAAETTAGRQTDKSERELKQLVISSQKFAWCKYGRPYKKLGDLKEVAPSRYQALKDAEAGYSKLDEISISVSSLTGKVKVDIDGKGFEIKKPTNCSTTN